MTLKYINDKQSLTAYSPLEQKYIQLAWYMDFIPYEIMHEGEKLFSFFDAQLDDYVTKEAYLENNAYTSLESLLTSLNDHYFKDHHLDIKKCFDDEILDYQHCIDEE